MLTVIFKVTVLQRALHDCHGLLRVASWAAEIDIRIGNFEFAEKEIAHLLVIMLSVIHENHLYGRFSRNATISGMIFMKLGRAPATQIRHIFSFLIVP